MREMPEYIVVAIKARRLYNHTQFTLTMNLSSRKFFNESLAPMGASCDTLLEEYVPERMREGLVST